MIYSNIFYFKRISAIGGTEQFLYEIAKKYNIYDITIFYDDADEKQLKRLKKFVRCKKHIYGKKVICKKAFFNFNLDMIDDVESIENYYAFVSHAIYQELGYKPPIDNPKLTHYIGVSDYSCKKLEEFGNIIGKPIKTIKCYNPISLEPKKKLIRIVSAGRLDDKTKDNGRTIILIKTLDKYAKEHNRNYIWTIFSNPISFNIDSPNVILMKPRVDVRQYIADADFVVQLSNNMETYCYTINETLGYGVRVITTPLTINKELNIPEEANFICEWDMSNVDKIVKRIFEEEYKEFKYTPPEDGWINIIDKEKSNYEEERKMKYLVEASEIYEKKNIMDNGLGRVPKLGEQWEVDLERLNVLLGDNKHNLVFVKLVKEINTSSVIAAEEENKIDTKKTKTKKVIKK